MGIRNLKYIKFRGALYLRAFNDAPDLRDYNIPQELDVSNKLLRAEDAPILRAVDSGILHVKSVIEEGIELVGAAKEILVRFEEARSELVACIRKHNPSTDDISLLDPETRKDTSALVKSMEKHNSSLNYTVDAAATMYHHIRDQVDALSVDHGATAAELADPPGESSFDIETVTHMDDSSALDEL